MMYVTLCYANRKWNARKKTFSCCIIIIVSFHSHNIYISNFFNCLYDCSTLVCSYKDQLWQVDDTSLLTYFLVFFLLSSGMSHATHEEFPFCWHLNDMGFGWYKRKAFENYVIYSIQKDIYTSILSLNVTG